MTVEYVPWSQFKRQLDWKQGEHVAAIAPTGAGKTTLLEELLDYRSYSIFFGTKPDDPMYHKIIKRGYRHVESWEEIKPWDKKVILWPRNLKTIRGTTAKQKSRFQNALDGVVQQGGWTVWFDECKYMAMAPPGGLGLMPELTYCMEQLRSIKSTVISGAQRPVWLPRSVLSNSTHVFIWKTTDSEDARRLSDIGGVNAKALMQECASLDEHEFIYIKTRGTSTEMVRSQVRKG